MKNIMNTEEFIEAFCKEYQTASSETGVWVRSIFEFAAECAASYEELKLAKFGIFSHRVVPATKYLNFQTGKTNISDPKIGLLFRPSQNLARLLNKIPVPQDLIDAEVQKGGLPARRKGRLVVEQPQVESAENKHEEVLRG